MLVDVVVVVGGSGTTVVDVVVVVVLVDEVVVVDSAFGTAGHDCVATVGTRRAGVADPVSVVVVVCCCVLVSVGIWAGSVVLARVLFTNGSVSKVTSAKESAGATAGASLWVHASS